MRSWIFVSAAMTTCAMAAGGANAQQSERANATPAEQGLSEIVVTAQRREENLQDVPIAATAFSGEALQDKGVERLADLQFAAPSLSVTDSGLTQSVNIRGIGIASGSPAVANGVATYIDGIFQPPVLTTSSFYDIQSVEVLRGPQGTLVGSNSTGGAVFVTTQNPTTDRVKGFLQGSYGTFDEVTAQGALNLPITDTLAVRAAGNFRSRDSYYEDLGPFDNKPDSLEEYAGRLSMLWQPGNFRALAKVEWIDKNTGGYAYRPIVGTAFDNNLTDDIRELTYNTPTLNYERGFLSSLELRYELDSGIVLRSMSGYSYKRINNLYDSDAAMVAPDPANSANQTLDQYTDERQYSQEVNIISPLDGAFNWILGGYYQKNDITVDLDIDTGGPVQIEIKQAPKKQVWGVFAHAGYKFNDQFELQFGLRYSAFNSTGTGSTRLTGIPIPFPPFEMEVFTPDSNSHKDDMVTGKLALNWTPDENNLIYAFAARGYKPGGANSATSEFGPESVWDYEIGWKSSFMDNRIRTQLGAFYMDYKNFQFDAIDIATGNNGVTNISNATIKGVEFQVQAQFGGFGIDGGIAYVDSSVDPVTVVNGRLLPPNGGQQLGGQCPPGVPSNPPVCFDYDPFLGVAGGGPNLFSPEWSYNISAHYEFLLGGDAKLTPRVSWAYVGPRWTNLYYDPDLDYLKGRGLLSAQLALDLGDWSIEAYGTNLANKEYVSGQSGNNAFYGAPREYGVRASVRF